MYFIHKIPVARIHRPLTSSNLSYSTPPILATKQATFTALKCALDSYVSLRTLGVSTYIILYIGCRKPVEKQVY